ncbi:MAG: F0F1 ATP synthase subunit B [Treponema sp.]|jgi:F-type H+-transporting ATPase subunit b|nr:F0F1 ATP synthase subunit B [Treponema sp.]
MLVPSLTTFLVTIANIVILFFVLRAVLFKPVTKFMEERTKKIENAISQAEKDKKQAKQTLAEYEARLKDAGKEAGAIIRSAREAAEKQAEEIIAGGREQAERIIDGARRQLRAEEEAALAQFRAEAAALVVAAAGRLVQRDFGGEDNLRLAAMLLREAGKN